MDRCPDGVFQNGNSTDAFAIRPALSRLWAKATEGAPLIMKVLRALLVLTVLLAVFILGGRLLYPLPDISDRAESLALPVDDSTYLGAFAKRIGADHPGKTGVMSLEAGPDALAARIALAEAAERSIDSQYYIWSDDTSGILLMDALYRAAERGAKVRLLLDDNGVPGMDAYMAAMNSHENFDIRLFNPSTVRSPKLMGYTLDFFRMNRRMHNKSFVVDGVAAIIGGRNVGDEYFKVGQDSFYVDLDVLATGKVVRETEEVFDAYWNSQSVYGVEKVIDGNGDLPGFQARVEEIVQGQDAKDFFGESIATMERFRPETARLEWTDVQLIADDPVKGLGTARPDQLTVVKLAEILRQTTSRLDLVSAYFVPGKLGVEVFGDLAMGGKQVNILTNALNTTDVLMVHSGYSKYRRALLEAGVDLFELKLRGGLPAVPAKQLRPFGLSGASLHAKTFAMDDERLFIGSFNFDPRSAQLNCEMGYLIDSPAMAKRISRAFDRGVPGVSYQPVLTVEGKMAWIEQNPEGEMKIYQEEPGATWFQQIAIVVIGVFPVEWML